MTIYFMNTGIIPSNFEGVVSVITTTAESIKDLIEKKDIISAIGHESTAQIISSKLGIEIKQNRLNVEAKAGDIFICFQLKQRGEEGKIYILEEMQNLECVWKLMRFTTEELLIKSYCDQCMSKMLY